jgi:hypothetical protein
MGEGVGSKIGQKSVTYTYYLNGPQSKMYAMKKLLLNEKATRKLLVKLKTSVM